MPKESKLKYIVVELGEHLPYSIFGVSLGLIMMGFLTFFAILMGAEGLLPQASEELFHVFHPFHVFFSAVATTAMFWKHERNFLMAVIVGFIGSVTICGLSDILFPFWGGIFLGQPMHFHVCLIESPGLIIPFAVIGVLAGIFAAKSFENSTEYSHSAHVFVSSMASVLYLLAFGLTDWIPLIGSVFMITIVAVMIPCCASDIAFPLACTHKHCTHE